MYIQHLTIQNFGGLTNYDTDLTQEVNLLDSRYAEEIVAAIGFFLCNKPLPAVPQPWLQEDTFLSAIICFKENTYAVCARVFDGQLQMSVTDPTGVDATIQYQHALSHCEEQDAIESFDGQDKETPLRLHRYWCRTGGDSLSRKTRYFIDTNLFRKYLWHYIHTFQPEPINKQKKYQVAIDPEGKFRVQHPCISGKICLSETEQKLFRYICFLNIVEFWAGFEAIRDLHHEKKPLLIQNFLEYLDDSANITDLIARTKKHHRQVLILYNRRKGK